MPSPTLNSSVQGNATASTVSITLPTITINDEVIVDIVSNGGPITNVTATGLTFTRHSFINAAGSNFEERWVAQATSSASNVNITVTQTSGAFITATAYSFSGVNTSAPFDSGGPITGSADPLSITTHNPNTTLIAFWRLGGATGTAGSGFTAIQNGNFQLVEYEAQASSGTFSAGTTGNTGVDGILDALVGASAVVVEAETYSPPPRTYPQLWNPNKQLYRSTAQDFSSLGVETNPHWRGLAYPLQWTPTRFNLQNTAEDFSSFGVETNPHWVGKTQSIQWTPLQGLMRNSDPNAPAQAIQPETNTYFVPRQFPLQWRVQPDLMRNAAQDFSSLGVSTSVHYTPRTWPFQWIVQQSLMRVTPQDFSSTAPVVTGFHILSPMGARLITPIGI